jgi:hypothetical protein
MPQLSLEQVRKISPKLLLKLINRVKNSIKNDKVFKDMCAEYKLDTSIIDLIPMKFGDIPVSARTANGIITLGYKLLTDGDILSDSHYVVHEVLHYLQQCYGDRPTQGAAEGDYLSNPAENQAFQVQLEYLQDHFGKGEAERYSEHLLDHHNKKGPERAELKEELLSKVNDGV